MFGSELYRMLVDKRIGWGFTNDVGTWEVLDVCMCFGCGDIGRVMGLGPVW